MHPHDKEHPRKWVCPQDGVCLRAECTPWGGAHRGERMPPWEGVFLRNGEYLGTWGTLL